MSAVLPPVLAGAAAAVLLGLPAPSRLPPGPAVPPPVARPRRRLPAAAAAAPAVLLLVPALGVAGAAVLCVLVAVVRRALRTRAAAQSCAAERAGTLEALTALAAELRAGRAPGDALGAAASVATGAFAATLGDAARAARFGADPVTVLRDGAVAGSVPEVLRGLAACWQVCGTTGSSLATAVERLVEAQRAQQALRLAVEGELAGPRATAVLLAVLPVAGIGLAAGLGARPLHVLLHTAAGSGCLVLGVGLDLLGLWWTGRLVTGAGGR